VSKKTSKGVQGVISRCRKNIEFSNTSCGTPSFQNFLNRITRIWGLKGVRHLV